MTGGCAARGFAACHGHMQNFPIANVPRLWASRLWGGGGLVSSSRVFTSAAIQNAGRVGASKRGEDGGPVHFAQVYTVLLPRRDCAPGPENQSPEGAPKPMACSA